MTAVSLPNFYLKF